MYFQQNLSKDQLGGNIDWGAPTHEVAHPMITCSLEVMEKIKSVISTLKTYDLQTRRDGDLNLAV